MTTALTPLPIASCLSPRPTDSASRPASAAPLLVRSRLHAERALALLHTHRGNARGEVDRLLVADPGNVEGHCLRAALLVLEGREESRIALAESVRAIESEGARASERERRHAAAAHAYLDAGASSALDHYGAIVVDWPRDILALVVAHALDFRLGRSRMLRDRPAGVLSEWDASVPGYGSVLAMYAFGLEENGQRRRAEATARRALTLSPGHPGAIHVVAHVMEMQGRARDGLAWLAATESAWGHGTGFSVHLAWHRAVFQLELDDVKAALATYDSQIAPSGGASAYALVDASALLWRLVLQDARVGDRWQTLARRWEVRLQTSATTFQSVHALMAFAAAEFDAASARVLDSLHQTKSRANGDWSADEALAHPLGEALIAFARKDFARCVDSLAHVRHLAHRCGGSLAQCDLIHLTLTEAALRARQNRLARALAAERTAQRPASLLNRLLRRRAQSLLPALG